MPTTEKGVADAAANKSRRPDRGERTLESNADEHHRRSAKALGRAFLAPGLPRDGRVDGPAGADVAADADAAASTAGDGRDAVRTAAATAAAPLRVIASDWQLSLFRSRVV